MNQPHTHITPQFMLDKARHYLEQGRPLRAKYSLIECALGEGASAQDAQKELKKMESSLQPKGKVPGITLCMIVKNEETCLAKCLSSIDPYVDEIVVVDTGSTDNTIEIAKGFGAKISTVDWIDDFSAARNASIEQAACRWILWLDADDIVPAHQNEVILRIKETPANCGYFARIVSAVENGENPEYLQLRFFPNLPQLRFEQRIHEQVAPSLARNGMKLADSGFRITHTGYFDPEKRREKARRNISLIQQELTRGKSLALLCALGDSLHVSGDFLSASQAYKEATGMKAEGDLDRSLFLQAHVSLALSLDKSGKSEEALAALEQLLKIEPDKADALFLASDLLFRAGQADTAQEYLLRVINAPERIGAAGVDYVKLKRNALIRLTSRLLDCGEWEKAFQYGHMGMERYPNVADFWISTAEALLSLRKIEEALSLFDRAIKAVPDSAGKAYAGKAGCLLAQGKIGEAMEVLDEGAHRTPNEPRIYQLKGDVFFSQKKAEPALEQYTRAIACGKAGVNLFWKAASCNADLKNFAESLRFVELILEAEPHNDAAKNTAEQLRALVEAQGA